MQKKITKKEEKRANDLKVKFSKVHNEIFEIQKQIERLNLQSESLILHLESLRQEEKKFMNDLSEKYGSGTLDPLQMTYTTNEREKQI